MSEPWIVLKFGGTSVAGRAQWDVIAEEAADRRAAGYRVLLVCSAVAGVTDALTALIRGGGPKREAVEPVLARHAELADELGIDATAILDQARRRILGLLESPSGPADPAVEAELLAQGEWLSTRLGARFLNARMAVDWVDAREALVAEPEQNPEGPRAFLSARCTAGLDEAVRGAWNELAPVVIAQGFVAAAPTGRTVLLGRGGSDTSAALLASRLGAERIEIWTDVAGLYSADPRSQPEARLLLELGFDEALEMAAGGARVIHPRSVRAATEGGIPVWIRNTHDRAAAGTRITDDARGEAQGVRAVVTQPDMAVILVQNMDLRQQVGFLAWVFAVIAEQGISVDQVATSETTTTLAFNRAANHLDDAALTHLADTLAQRCRVEVFPTCCCVNLVGRGARTALARLGPVGSFFAENPLLMMSQSANDLSISLLVTASCGAPLADILHAELVVRA